MLADRASQAETAARAGDVAGARAASDSMGAMLTETTRIARASFATGHRG